MGSRGKLCFCTTSSNNALWGSFLSIIDRWLKLVGTYIFFFLEFRSLKKSPKKLCTNLSLSCSEHSQPSLAGYCEHDMDGGLGRVFRHDWIWGPLDLFWHFITKKIARGTVWVYLPTTPSGGTCMTACTLHKSQRASSSLSRLTKKVTWARCGDEKSF